VGKITDHRITAEINELTYIQSIEQCLACDRHSVTLSIRCYSYFREFTEQWEDKGLSDFPTVELQIDFLLQKGQGLCTEAKDLILKLQG
jgi:hypothetical protein